MSFSAELKDFVSGFKSGFEMGKPPKRTAADAALEEQERVRGVFRTGAAGVDTSGAIPDAPRRTAGNDASAAEPTLPTFARGDPLAKLVLTTYGEAADEGPEGWRGVAATVANRSQASGRSLDAEVTRKGQFEPWMTAEGRARMRRITPEQYAAIRETVAPIAEGNIPEQWKGVTHFYAPKAQRALGRAAPAWDDGSGTDVGNHRFFRRQYSYDDTEELPTVYAARGGAIDISAGDTEHSGSNPAVRDAIEDDDYDPMPFAKDIDTIADMTRQGFTYLQGKFGLDKTGGVAEASPRAQDGMRAYALNVGAARPEEVEQIKNTVDPKRKLPNEELRAIAGWNAVYKYHTRNGNAAAAQRAAAAMLMYSKQAAQVAGSMGLAAAEDGNKMGLARAISSGYESLPDGKSLKVLEETPKGVKFQLVDENGDITEQGEATMDQMVKIATGMQNGTEWFRAANLLQTRKKPDRTAERQERERGAIEDFDATLTETDRQGYIATLTDAQREAFLKMPRAAQHMRAREWERLQQEKRMKEGTGRGAGGTAGERADKAIDIEAETERSAIAGSVPEGEYGPAAANIPQRLQAADANRGFQRRANDRGASFDADDFNAAKERVAELWNSPKLKEKPDFAPLGPREHNSLAYLVSDMTRTSDVTVEVAADLAFRAVNPGVPIAVDPRTGAVQIGNERPVFLSRRSMLELAQMRAAKGGNPGGNSANDKRTEAAPAQPGATAPAPVSTAGRRSPIEMAGDARTSARAWLDRVLPGDPPAPPAQARRQWANPPREWVDPPTNHAATTQKYDTNPARRRKEARDARRRGIPF